ncbi:MAG: hypothetical protein IJX56_04900 [Alistipes sp.]|nr:hypothetical protein [Alistipes sp.]
MKRSKNHKQLSTDQFYLTKARNCKMRSISDLRLYFKLKAKFPIFRPKKSDSKGWILDVFGPKKDEKTGTKREKKAGV